MVLWETMQKGLYNPRRINVLMKVQRCPKCKSREIDLHAGALTGAYHCQSCGLITPMVLEEDIEVPKED